MVNASLYTESKLHPLNLWDEGISRLHPSSLSHPSEKDRQQGQPTSADSTTTWSTSKINRLVGLVVKASASRAGDPGLESRLRRDFFGVESYQ